MNFAPAFTYSTTDHLQPSVAFDNTSSGKKFFVNFGQIPKPYERLFGMTEDEIYKKFGLIFKQTEDGRVHVKVLHRIGNLYCRIS